MHTQFIIESILSHFDFTKCQHCVGHDLFQALAMPREILLNKVPFPLPKPEMLNLDHFHAFTTDTVVSENGEFLA